MHSVVLDGPVDIEGFRRAARELLTQQIPPGQIACRNQSLRNT